MGATTSAVKEQEPPLAPPELQYLQPLALPAAPQQHVQLCAMTQKALNDCVAMWGSRESCMALVDAHRKCLRDKEIK
ncbi:unnamed protein product, partial [Mesorhabditis spiculigera]